MHFWAGGKPTQAAGGRARKDNNWAGHKQKMTLHFHGRGSNLKKYILSMFLHKKEETRWADCVTNISGEVYGKLRRGETVGSERKPLN